MMKKYNKITLLLLLAVLGMQGVKAQDVGFSQFYANPLYLNPAFAGSKVAPRISLSYRAQWPGLVSAFSTVSASYDQYIPDLHGGIGAIVLSDRQGDHGILSSTYVGAMYSFRFKLVDDIFINLALQASLVNGVLHWDLNNMRFPDQIDPNGGFIDQTSAVAPDVTNKFYPDFASGLMVYGPAWYAGFAAHHLNRPSQGFYSEDRVPMKFTANAGGLINLSEERRRQSSLGLGQPVVSPNFIYQYQGGFHYFNYGLYLDWMPSSWVCGIVMVSRTLTPSSSWLAFSRTTSRLATATTLPCLNSATAWLALTKSPSASFCPLPSRNIRLRLSAARPSKGWAEA